MTMPLPAVTLAGAREEIMICTLVVAITLFFITGWKWWLYVALIALILWINETK